MSTAKLSVVLAGFSFLILGSEWTLAQEGPNLGVPAAPEEVAAWDISISPDGDGLPGGSGTAAEGKGIYTAKCLACHGQGGQGFLNDKLVGGHGTLSGPAPVKTVGSYWPYATTIFDYVRRAMPYLQPQTLSGEEVYALTAYLLFLNDIITEDEVMNAQTLPRVNMPNQGNFILAYPSESQLH
ncbi:MAG: cytochrome c [Gammaproteobacteria bacterium]